MNDFQLSLIKDGFLVYRRKVLDAVLFSNHNTKPVDFDDEDYKSALLAELQKLSTYKTIKTPLAAYRDDFPNLKSFAESRVSNLCASEIAISQMIESAASRMFMTSNDADKELIDGIQRAYEDRVAIACPVIDNFDNFTAYTQYVLNSDDLIAMVKSFSEYSSNNQFRSTPEELIMEFYYIQNSVDKTRGIDNGN